MAAHTVDADDLLIHAEARIGDSTIMMCDAKPHWAFTRALLQVYVRSASSVVDLARAKGATVIRLHRLWTAGTSSDFRPQVESRQVSYEG